MLFQVRTRDGPSPTQHLICNFVGYSHLQILEGAFYSPGSVKAI